MLLWDQSAFNRLFFLAEWWEALSWWGLGMWCYLPPLVITMAGDSQRLDLEIPIFQTGMKPIGTRVSLWHELSSENRHCHWRPKKCRANPHEAAIVRIRKLNIFNYFHFIHPAGCGSAVFSGIFMHFQYATICHFFFSGQVTSAMILRQVEKILHDHPRARDAVFAFSGDWFAMPCANK